MTYTGLIIGGALMLALSGVVGCAGPPSPEPRASQVPMSQDAGDLAFQYKRQATTLHELAQRYDLEARLLWSLKGGQHPETLGKLDLARSLWAQAEEADDLARAYRRQIPHNRTY